MKSARLFVKILPFIAASSVGSAAAVWSPISCGCLDPWESITIDLELKNVRSSNDITAKLIADAVSRKLSGRSVTIRDMPFSTSTYDCALATSPTRTIRCRWWLWESGDDRKGFDVVVSTTASGLFERVSVTPVFYIQSEHLPVTPNKSFKPNPLRGSA